MTGASGTEIVVASIGVSAVIAAGYSIHRALKSIRLWVRRLISIAKHEFSDAVDRSRTGQLVKHHLVDNGTTTPMYQRVAENQATELAHHEENQRRLTAIEGGQQAAASAVVAAEVDAERRRTEGP